MNRQIERNSGKNLKDLGFKNIIRVSGFKDPDPNRGCAYSHALALEEVDAPFILLEDDCMPLNLLMKLKYQMRQMLFILEYHLGDV